MNHTWMIFPSKKTLNSQQCSYCSMYIVQLQSIVGIYQSAFIKIPLNQLWPFMCSQASASTVCYYAETNQHISKKRSEPELRNIIFFTRTKSIKLNFTPQIATTLALKLNKTYKKMRTNVDNSIKYLSHYAQKSYTSCANLPKRGLIVQN